MRLELRSADPGLDVALVAVVGDDRVGVLLELGFLVGAAAGQPGEHPVLLGLLHLAAQGAVAHRRVADEVDLADADLRALLHVEGDLDQLGAAGQRLDVRGDLGELEALLGHHLLDDALHPPHRRVVEERVEAQRHPELLHLLVDLGALDLARPGVVDDLHARPLFHVEDHALADDAVLVGLVDRLDPQVVEEVGPPQPPEVVADLLLGGLVVGHPHAIGAAARLRLDVIQVGLRLDQRLVDRVEAELEEANDRARPGRPASAPQAGRLERWAPAGDAGTA